jgi:hypothetical protein
MKHLDDLEGPTDAELADLEAEFDEDADFEGVVLPGRSAEYEANQREYEATTHAPAEDDDSRRARLHRNARDMTRIEHDTVWAYISKAGSFLGPKEARDTNKE